MNELREKVRDLADRLEKALTILRLENERQELRKLEAESQEADFWDNSEEAQSKMQELATVKKHLEAWDKTTDEINGLSQMLENTAESDSEMICEMQEEVKRIGENFEKLEFELMFSGVFDPNNAILTVSAGSGGTDAQDWAEMLLKMYSKYLERNGFHATIVDESRGDEAGIKSATVEVTGKFAYGYLKSEHGVHRLVRISPFDADKARHTSFALVEVVPEIEEGDIEIDDKDLKIETFRSSGHGGQSVNTTDSAVRITHLPSGVSATSQNERSQLQNRENAMKIVRARLVDLEEAKRSERIQAIKGKPVSAEWGNQIRSYVLQPYTRVVDNRTGYEESDTDSVLSGNIDRFIEAFLRNLIEKQ